MPKQGQKGPKGVKRTQKGIKRAQNLYLANHWSQKLGRPLISIRKIMFLLVFHMFYTCQITGSAQNAHIGSKGTKMGQKDPKSDQKGPKSISCEPSVIETWQTPYFNQKDHVSFSFSYISYLSDNRKCSKMPKQGQKGPKGGQKGPKSISQEPLVVETWQTPHFNQK